MKLHWLILFSLFILFPANLFSQKDSSSFIKQDLVINKFSNPVRFDGIPDEEAWESITPIKLTMHSPVFGKEPSEETDVRIGYDDKYLFIGGRINYKDPGMMRSVSFKRDFMGMGGDWFGIILDTYNDKENGVAFFVSPDALRWDASILRDAVVSFPDQSPININLNAFWDVLTRKTQNGWTAEIRIPFSSIRFQEINNIVHMGLIVQRWIPSKNELDTYPAIQPDWGESSAIKPSQAQNVIIRGIRPVLPVYIAPYLLTGYESKYELNSAETSYTKSDNPALEAGIDIKYGITSNLVMDITANTDFAQVESDDQQFNMTRYSLYLPEKRVFFLERASILDFNLGATSTLFYSRRIGLTDDGDPVRIFGGLRMIGRINKWDIGLLDMQTQRFSKINDSGIKEDVLPSENFGVLRLKRQVINENSYVGSIVTSRAGDNGNYNIAYGLDGIIRLFGQDYLDWKWSQTFETDTINNSFKEPLRFSVGWERRSKKGLGYNIGYSYSGIHFNPGIGFEMTNDYSSIRSGLRYGWLPGEKSKLYMHNVEARMRYMRYAIDGSLMTYSNNTGWTFQTKSQWQGDFFFVHHIENLKDSLILVENKTYAIPGRYEFAGFMGMITTPPTRHFYTILSTETGQYYDGSRFSIQVQPTWNLSRHLELSGSYNFDHVDFRLRNQKMDNHIIGVRTLYMLNTKFSVNAFIQYNTALNEVLTNFRLRYNPREGNDFYIVLNEGRNTNLTRETPNLPEYNSRSLLLKYTYTFNIR